MKAIGHDGGKGVAFQPCAAPSPGEIVFTKNVSSAFVGTDLEQTIRDRGITELVVAGMTTDGCVSTSVRMAANLGVKPERVVLRSDATAMYERGIGQLSNRMTWDAEFL